MARRHIDDAERRARLVVRHHLARTAADPLAAVRGVAAMHSSDPITPYLGAWARIPGFTIADLDRAMFDERALWRLHAMRRTLFVVPRDEAAAFIAGAGLDVTRAERKRLEGWVAAELPARRVKRWLVELEAGVLAALADGAELQTQDLALRVPELAREVTLGAGKWTQRVAIGSRLLFLMAMEGRIVRTRPIGTWRSSQYRWVATAAFTGAPAEGLPTPDAGRATIIGRYLATHGPATMTDIRWWTGFGAAHVKVALAALGAVVVDLDGGGEGWVLPEDVDPAPAAPEHVSLLPGLDPTAMGWKERAFYLDPAMVKQLFDTNGNAGPTVWVDGRVVGGWGQRPEDEGAAVVSRLLVRPRRGTAERVASEAAALGAWLAGTRAIPRFRTPLDKELSG